jgi:transcriptional regulator with XRE-family HTH domain
MSNPGYNESTWEAIRAMWMAGSSASSIAQKDGMPSKQAICVKAKEEGWEKLDRVDEELELIPFDGLTEQQCFAVRKLADGLPKKHVAALCGIDPTTLSRWLSDNADFAKAAQAAIAAKTYRRLKKVESTEDWKAQTWLLERDKDSREEFGAPKQSPPAAFNFNVLGHMQVGIERAQTEQPALIEATSDAA